MTRTRKSVLRRDSPRAASTAAPTSSSSLTTSRQPSRSNSFSDNFYGGGPTLNYSQAQAEEDRRRAREDQEELMKCLTPEQLESFDEEGYLEMLEAEEAFIRKKQELELGALRYFWGIGGPWTNR